MANDSKPLTASILKDGLKGDDLKERLEGKRSVHCEMEYNKPPKVWFEGFWNATFMNGAINSISKAYRLRRAKPGDKRNLKEEKK